MTHIRLFGSGYAASLALAAALWVTSAAEVPTEAHAQDGNWGGGGSWCELECAVLGVAIITVPTSMLLAEGVFAVQGRWFPVGWAIGEVAVGLPLLGLGVIASTDDADPGFSLLAGGLGLWFMTHAIISLAVGSHGGDDRAGSHARLTRWLEPVRFDL